MLTGSLRIKGYSFGEKQVGQAFQSFNSVASSKKKVKAGRLLNPRVYSKEYFGHKIHYDHNEKLAMYGAVHVYARDGYSGMIVEFTTMPVKICLTIHDQIYLYIFLPFCSVLLYCYFLCSFSIIKRSKNA